MVFTVGHSVIEFGVRHWHPSFMLSCSFQLLSQLVFFRTFDDDQGLQEQWPPLAERARRESGELHLPPLDTELTGRTQEHAGRKVRNPMVLTPPARIKKKSEISSPIELIRSVRALCEASHLRGLGLHLAREPLALRDGITERAHRVRTAQNVLQGRGRPESRGPGVTDFLHAVGRGTQFTVLLSTSWPTKCRVAFSLYLSNPGSSGSRGEMAMVVLCYQSCSHTSSCCPCL